MARRALVVDDSRSTREFLTRILERYEISVEAVESAEQAIDYLAQQRPDVIFMDHLMPGMDGLQAVQAIKNNPRTATIPIMMYTSQQGELYLSQARALGAIGVLPKQIKPADVCKALEQLRLESGVPANERRTSDRPDAPILPPQLRTVLEALLAHHDSELRRFVVENLETHADRIRADMKLLLQDVVREPLAGSPEILGGPLVPWLATAGFIVAALFGVLWWQRSVQSQRLTMQLARSQQQLADTRNSLQALQAIGARAAAGTAAGVAISAQPTSMVESVPFGEIPLGGARLGAVSRVLMQLSAQGFRGVLQIRSIPGRYCMIDGPGGQPVLPTATVPYSKCDQVGNPHGLDDSASERQSIAFADMISTARAGAKFDIQVSAGTADEVAIPYPTVTDALTAGEWNRAAAANNRVLLRWQTSSP